MTLELHLLVNILWQWHQPHFLNMIILFYVLLCITCITFHCFYLLKYYASRTYMYIIKLYCLCYSIISIEVMIFLTFWCSLESGIIFEFVCYFVISLLLSLCICFWPCEYCLAAINCYLPMMPAAWLVPFNVSSKSYTKVCVYIYIYGLTFVQLIVVVMPSFDMLFSELRPSFGISMPYTTIMMIAFSVELQQTVIMCLHSLYLP